MKTAKQLIHEQVKKEVAMSKEGFINEVQLTCGEVLGMLEAASNHLDQPKFLSTQIYKARERIVDLRTKANEIVSSY